MPVNSQNIKDVEMQVIDKVGNPVNVMVVKAALESMGIREKDVIVDYGYCTLMELAKLVYKSIKQRNPKEVLNINERKPKNLNKSIPISDYLWVKAKLFAKYYPLGIFHLMPVFIQIASIIVYGYSLWTYMGFNIIQSTSVVFGVILGIVLSGGYVQMLGRQASFYWNHKEYYKTKIVTKRLVISGIKGMTAVFAFLLIINYVLGTYPTGFVLVTICYGFLIGLLLLVMAPYHAIRQRWVISVVIVVSSLFALMLHFYTSFHIYITQWLSIVLAISLSQLYLYLFFKLKITKDKPENLKPRQLMVIYKNYPYFFYGILIYVFIFIDRFLAWSADIELTYRYLFLYEKSYEIGMDLAIVVFFILVGVMEYAIASFTKFMDLKQRSIMVVDKHNFGKSLFKNYKNHVLILFVMLLLVSMFLYCFITNSWGYQTSFGEQIDVLSIRVCVIGGLGYFFLSWAMLNALYLFTLNRPNEVLKALIVSSIINFTIGFFISRWVSYEYSVVGMLTGSVVFMVYTTNHIKAYFKQLDFYYYAAY
jgi:hypothetical protein